MRKEFSQALERVALADEKIVFITGDLGYNALENLRDKLGPRFINAGVAEQNMVGLAAGMAYRGFKVFCYSIAPFIVYRCLEQFRVDVCLHRLPVFLVGNGGGYGYGIMGSTHHAIEDLAALSSLQNVTCWVPAFAEEVDEAIDAIVETGRPAYLRLGVGRALPTHEGRSGSVKIIQKSADARGTVLALGPSVTNVLAAFEREGFGERFNLLTALTLPLELTDDVAESIRQGENLLVVEEHVSVGGLAQQASVQLLERGVPLRKFRSLHAAGYPSGLYGDQAYHQRQSGLDVDGITTALHSFLD
jgi:transketolase